MSLRIFSLLITLALSQISSVNAFTLDTPPSREQLTFDYSEDTLNIVKQLPKPSNSLSSEELSRLTKEVSYIVDTKKNLGADGVILPAYIANAQKDFAWLSYLLTGEFTGSLGPVTLWTLQLFFKDATIPSLSCLEFDVFTSTLAALVVQKYAARLQEEKKQLTDYPIKEGEGLWKHSGPGYIGLNYGSIKPWFLASSKEFIVNEPPSFDNSFWNNQVEMVKEDQLNIDGKKVQLVFSWAGLTSPDAGSFEKFLYGYLDEKKIPLAEQLYLRALYLSTLSDTAATCFNSKYTYWVMRPFQRDEEIKPLVETPNHPSYPSGHSTVSSAACTLLSYLFPLDGEKWKEMANEAGMSRIWGGIHFPIDHQVGQQLGKKIALTVLQRTGSIGEEKAAPEKAPQESY